MKHIFLLAFLTPLLFLSCNKISRFDYKIVVKDNNGTLWPNTDVKFYHIASDLDADTNAYLSLYTNSDGEAKVPRSMAYADIICRAEAKFTYDDHYDVYTNEYFKTVISLEKRTYNITIVTPSREVKLCGHGSKKWKLTQVNHFGSSQPFTECITTFNLDGTWTDDSGNIGEWEFLEDGRLVYDSPIIPLTDTFYPYNMSVHSMHLKKTPTESWELFMEEI